MMRESTSMMNQQQQANVRFRRYRDQEPNNSASADTNLLGHSYGTAGSNYGDFDYEVRDGFSYARGDMHGSYHGNRNGVNRHRRSFLNRIAIGSLCVGLFFYFGSSAKSVKTETTLMKANPQGSTKNKKKQNNGNSIKKLDQMIHDRFHPEIEEAHRHIPIVQPRRFQKTVIAKPLPMTQERDLPENVSGFLIYGSSPTTSSSSGGSISSSTYKTKKQNETPPVSPLPDPPMESTSSKTTSTQEETMVAPPLQAKTNSKYNSDGSSVVYYYFNKNTNTSELPEALYDANGNKIDYKDLIGTELILEHPPPMNHPPPPPQISMESDKIEINQTMHNSTHAVFQFPSYNSAKENLSARVSNAMKSSINASDWESIPQAQDQMIIISTVATMALLVGALSARRLRSRHFLSSCIENESLEDELAYDTAYTTSAGQHGGSGGYDTFTSTGSSSGLPWRGDLEKFDV